MLLGFLVPVCAALDVQYMSVGLASRPMRLACLISRASPAMAWSRALGSIEADGRGGDCHGRRTQGFHSDSSLADAHT